MTIRWVSELVVDDRVAFRIGRGGDELVAEWMDLCELRSDRAGSRHSFSVREGADARLVAKVRAGLAPALLRHLKGETSLHASAVGRSGQAFAFLGASGSGKSTLGAWLCKACGFALLADDILRVSTAKERPLVEPTETDHWLTAGSLAAVGLETPSEIDEGKAPVPGTAVATVPMDLRAMFALVLEEGAPARPTVTRLRGHRAMAVLLPCLVRFVIDEPAAQRDEVERIADLLEHVPLYELRADRRYDVLPRIAQVLEEFP